jgi:hypothetical protein
MTNDSMFNSRIMGKFSPVFELQIYERSSPDERADVYIYPQVVFFQPPSSRNNTTLRLIVNTLPNFCPHQ